MVWTKLRSRTNLSTEWEIKVCTWLREISFCSCLTLLPGPAWVLLSKTCKPLFTSLYLAEETPWSPWDTLDSSRPLPSRVPPGHHRFRLRSRHIFLPPDSTDSSEIILSSAATAKRRRVRNLSSILFRLTLQGADSIVKESIEKSIEIPIWFCDMSQLPTFGVFPL